MSQYYYTTDGTNVDGPVTISDLQNMLYAGQIEGTTLICPIGTENWLSAHQILENSLSQPSPPPNSVSATHGYVEQNLNRGESVIYSAKVHWGIYLMIVPVFLIFEVLFIGLLLFSELASVSSLFWLLALIPFVLFIHGWLVQKTTELTVTSKRVITKVGLISRQTSEILLPKVESVEVDQGIFGRILNYGTVIVRGTGGGVAPAPAISDPLKFRQEVQRMAEQ
jgi:hypothetical protein